MNSYLRKAFYFPFAEVIVKTLEPFFIHNFVTSNEYKAAFYAWEKLRSLMFVHYECDDFPSDCKYYPRGLFCYYGGRLENSPGNFYSDFWTTASQLQDYWPPIKQGLFDGKYSELKRHIIEANDDYSRYF